MPRTFYQLESLESRLPFAVGAIADSIDIASAQQLLLGPAPTDYIVTSPTAGTNLSLWSFVIDGEGETRSVTLEVEPVDSQSTADAAIVLYDASGHRIESADTDSIPNSPGRESLMVSLESRHVHAIALQTPLGASPDNFRVTITPSTSVIEGVIRLDPATGTAVHDPDSSGDTFQSPRDVDYYAIDLTNASQSATVTIEGVGLDVHPMATLFTRDNTESHWRIVATGVDASSNPQGGATTLVIPPPLGRTLSDGEYVLAVAPRQFNTAARAYRVSVQAAAPLLAPALLAPNELSSATGKGMLEPTGSDNAGLTWNSPPGAPSNLARFRVPNDGTLRMNLSSVPFAPVISLYDAGTGELIDVSGRSQSGGLQLRTSVVAGHEYVARVGVLNGGPLTAFTLNLSMPVDAELIDLSNANGPATAALEGLHVSAAAGGRFLEIPTTADTDVLVIEAHAATGSSTTIRLVAYVPGVGRITRETVPGAPLHLPVTIKNSTYPTQIYLESANDTPVSLRVGRLSIPKTFDPSALPSAKLTLAGQFDLQDTSTAAARVQPAGGFGSSVGLEYYQGLAAPSAPMTQMEVVGNHVSPLIARYEYASGLLRLQAWSLPTAGEAATLAASVPNQRLSGIVAIPLTIEPAAGSTPTITFSVQTPTPLPVGVSMLNDIDVSPGTPAKPRSVLKIENITLEEDFEQDLWSTVLPTHLVEQGRPVIHLGPAAALANPGLPNLDEMRLRVTVLRASGEVLAVRESTTAGQVIELTLGEDLSTAQQIKTFVDSLRGQRLLLRVEPLSGSLGTGVYTLRMLASTLESAPFEVTETTWKFPGAGNVDCDPGPGTKACDGTFPLVVDPSPFNGINDGLIRDVVQNQFGRGSIEGNFTSSLPYSTGEFGNAGALHVYRFWATQGGPVTVRTVPIDAGVNTSIGIYRAQFDSQGVIRYYRQVGEGLFDLDWKPADRSEIDAQIVVSDFELMKYTNGQGDANPGAPYGSGGGMYFAVVKNEQGSLGRYRLEVDTASFPWLNGVNPSVSTPLTAYEKAKQDPAGRFHPINGGTLTLRMRYLERFSEFVGYYPLQVPEHHDGTLQLSSSNGSRWKFAAFDFDGRPLAGGQTYNQATQSMSGSFTLPAGAQTVFVRLQEVGDNLDTATVHATVNIRVPVSLVAPPTTLPATIVPAVLPINQFGAGSATAITAVGQRRAFAFNAAAGLLRVHVQPDSEAAGHELRYSVYLNGSLVAWNQTPPPGQWNDSPDRFATDLLMPNLRQPLPRDEYGRDLETQQLVVVMVESVASHGNANGFTVSVEGNVAPQSCADPAMNLTNAPDTECADRLPLQTNIVRINPLTGASNAMTTQNHALVRLDVPVGVAQNSVKWTVTGSGNPHVELYDLAGTKIANLTIPSGQLPVFTLPVAGGTSYFVRSTFTGGTNSATSTVGVLATATLSKATNVLAGRPTATIAEVPPLTLRQANPTPDGKFDHSYLTNLRQAFWVDQAGVASFNVVMDNQVDRYVALYRGRRDCFETGCGPIRGELVDYANSANAVSGINYPLTAYVEPGMYFLTTNDSSPWYRGDLPDYHVREIVLDPEEGISDLRNLVEMDRPQAPENRREDYLESFRTSVYHVTTPASSQAGVMTFASSYSCENPLENGTGSLALYTSQGAGYVSLSTANDSPVLNVPICENLDGNPDAEVSDTAATAFKEYFVAFHRFNLTSDVGTSAVFEVPNSGTPDLVVEPIRVYPADGQTRVEVTVRNDGNRAALKTWARFDADSMATPGVDLTSIIKERTLAARSSRTHVYYVTPDTPADTFRYATDYVAGLPQGNLVELSEINNIRQRTLCDVSLTDNVGDCHAPVMSFSLADGALDGSGANDSIWGRYLAGVLGLKTDVNFQWSDADDPNDTDGDGATDLLHAIGYRPSYFTETSSQHGQIFFLDPGENRFPNYDLGNTLPTSGANPNVLRATAFDRYGLRSPEFARTLQVVARPGWLTGDSIIDYDATSREYLIHFHKELIQYDQTVDQILGLNVPFIGDKHNKFIVELNADTTASLNPATVVTAAVTPHVQFQVLNKDVYNATYTASQVGPVDVATNVAINPVTLEATAFQVGLGIDDLNLANYQSPEIRLFSYGISGVASLNANLNFTVDANLDAGLTVDMNPNVIQDPLDPPMPLGLSAPSYVQPSVTLGANVEGEIELLGFDIASLSGGMNFTLAVTVGLDGTNPAHVVSFDDVTSQLCVDVSGNVGIEFLAEVLGFDVWSYEKDFPSFQLATTCNNGGILTNDGVVGQNFARLITDLVGGLGALNGVEAIAEAAAAVPGQGPGESFFSGDSRVGTLTMEPSPQVVVDATTGRGYFLQLVDPQPADEITSARLAFSRRDATNNDWTPLAVLPGSAHISSPALAFTNANAIGGATQAVVAYAALDAGSTDPSSLSRNAFVNGQEIRYRHYDGNAWSSEQALTTDGFFDANPALAFNRPLAGNIASQGVLAWTRVGITSPIDQQGRLDRSNNAVAVSLWDATNQVWQPPVTLDVAGVADSSPAVYVDENGTSYVAWLQDTATGNRVMFSTHTNGAWTEPRELPIRALPAGGEIRSLAIGSEGPSRIDVLFNHVTPSPDSTQPGMSAIYNRPSTLAGFGQPTAVEVVASNANFSNLRTLRAPDGSLVAYWQQSDGVINELFGSRIGPSNAVAPVWSAPFALSNGAEIEYDPSVAMEPNNQFLVVAAHKSPVNDSEAIAAPQVPATPHAALDASLPPAAGSARGHRVTTEASVRFTQPLTMAWQNEAPAGASAVAEARLINTGPAEAHLIVNYYIDTPSNTNPPVASEIVQIRVGESRTLAHEFVVAAGSHTYFAVVYGASNGLPASSEEPVAMSSTVVQGLADLTISELRLEQSRVVPGERVGISAKVTNASALPIGPASVSFYLGDPARPASQPALIAKVAIPSLAAFQTANVQAHWDAIAPKLAADWVITAVATPDGATDEAAFDNNRQWARIGLYPDAVLASSPAAPAIKATLLSLSGTKNVAVDVSVQNSGNVPLTKLPVQLNWTREDGTMVPMETRVIDKLDAGAQLPLRFVVDGWDGMNRYTVRVLAPTTDADPTNHVASADLMVHGLPDLTVGDAHLSLSTAGATFGPSVELVLANQGIAEARNVRVEIFWNDPEASGGLAPTPAVLLGTSVEPRVQPLGSALVRVPVDLSHVPTGSQSLCVVVNRLDEVFERNAMDNVKCFTVTIPPPIIGDIDGNGQVDAVDIDALCAALLSGNQDSRYDLNLDQVVNQADMDELITDIVKTTIGDANVDHLFDSSDLVLVFQAGEYEDGIVGNSRWATGDWNCDGDFDTSDLVAAFQKGAYHP